MAPIRLIEPGWRIQACRDPTDDKLLELAVAGDAGYLVTGDDDLLAMREFEGDRILTPAQFLALLGQ